MENDSSFVLQGYGVDISWGIIFRNAICELHGIFEFGVEFEVINWFWHEKYSTVENDGSIVPQGYGVDISWGIFFRSVFCELHGTFEFGVDFEVISWFWHEKYLTMENDGSIVPQGYGVDISWGIIFRNVFCELDGTFEFGLDFEVINWFWLQNNWTMENDSSFVLQGYGVDISWGIIFRNAICELHGIFEFGVDFEVINWFWHEKYLTMENDDSIVPQGYGVDISWGIIFRSVFCELHGSIEFGLLLEVINWFWHEKYLTMDRFHTYTTLTRLWKNRYIKNLSTINRYRSYYTVHRRKSFSLPGTIDRHTNITSFIWPT